MTNDIDAILAKSTLPWWEWDIASNRVLSNSLKITTLGYSESEFIDCPYQKYTDLLHPDDYKKTMDAMYRVLRKETDLYDIDYRIKNSAGEYQWYIDRGFVINKDANGNPLRIRGIVLNAGLKHTQQSVENLLKVIIRTTGFIKYATLCSNCKKIKVTDSQWESIHTDSVEVFTKNIAHTICPSCLRRLYPDLAEKLLGV
jgi:PAS domain S-box-containing protein